MERMADFRDLACGTSGSRSKKGYDHEIDRVGVYRGA
jgi:hypothetical protein